MLLAKEAESIIFDHVQPLDAQLDGEQLHLTAAGGRILATAIAGPCDFPYWDNSSMDGYAVRFDDVQDASPDQPVRLEIVEDIPAGYSPQKIIQPGQAARIFTGAVMPEGADTVVIQENTHRHGQQVEILMTPNFQANVRHQGAFYQAGFPVLQPGTYLNAPELAVLATLQCPQVKVYRRPKVAILSTGNELVTPEQPLSRGQIVDSNQIALAALVAQAGGQPLSLGIIPDDPEALRQAIAQAVANADLILSSGGVSVGDYDYVDQVLAELGATIHIRSVAIRPGKPLTFATFAASPQPHERSRLYFGLPGNPVSALVGFWRFVQPALKKLSGLAQGWQPEMIQAQTQQLLQADSRRETYLWGQVSNMNGRYEFNLATGSHSSGNLINLAHTNGLAVVQANQSINPGEPVSVLQTGPLLFSA